MMSMKCFLNTKCDNSASAESVTKDSKKRRLSKTGFLGSLGVILVVGSLGLAVYFYLAYQKALVTQTPSAELAALLISISKHFELPSGETPTLATVTDQEKLSGQDFFAASQNGDKVLLYQEAKQAILYRPSTGKIVNVAAINTSEPVENTPVPVAEETQAVPEESAPVPTMEAIESEPVKVVLLNGSTKVGVTQVTEEKLVAAVPEGIAVVGKEKASKNTYQGIIIADITGRVPAKTLEIAAVLGGAVGAAPSEELIPEGADIVVIIGNAALDVAPETVPSSKAKPAAVESVDIVPKAGAAAQQ